MDRRDFLLQTGIIGAGLLASSPALAREGVAVNEANPTPVQVLEALWQALKDHYPMLEFVGAYDDAWLEEFRPRVAAAPDLEAAYPLLEEFVCRLRDYHTRLWWPGKPNLNSLPVLGHLLPGHPERVVIRKSGVEAVAPGEEVVTLDGAPIAEELEKARRFAVGGTPEAQARSAMNRMLAAPQDTERIVGIRRDAGDPVREVRLRASGYLTAEPTIAHWELDTDTGYVRIPRWNGGDGEDLAALFDGALETYRRHPALIIDVRDNGGGQDALADAVTGRFLQKKTVSSISFHRKTPSLEFIRTVEWCEPRGPWCYEGWVAVLIDEGCASACEHFVSGMIGAGACLVGMPTSGACGWIRRIELPGGAVLFCSRTFPLHGGTPSPRHGLEPHFRVPLTRKDLRSGKDRALDEARRWLRSGEPLPVRRQPTF